MGLRIDLAGDVSIDHDGQRLDRRAVRGSQTWIAFALLVLARGRPVSRDELADALWPRELPDTWESSLRNTLTKVRDLLAKVDLPGADLLVRSDAGWSLSLPAGTQVDLDEAEHLLAAAAEHLAGARHDDAARAAEGAVAILAQPLLAGVDGTWLDQLRDRLQHERSNAEELHGTALLGTGDHKRAAAVTEDLLRTAPYRESAYRLLMEIHDSSGNRAEALRTYERCRQLLAEELGVQPSEATEQAYLALLGPEKGPTSPTPTTRAAPHPAPAVAAVDHDLLGRDDELARLQELLGRPGLVSLVGPGGVGKSTLARAAAGLVVTAPVDRRWWADLAAVPPDAVASAVAATVTGSSRSMPGADPEGALRETLQDEPALLLLDDCERSIAAIAELVAPLLTVCPLLTVLLTSRIPAGLAAETRVEVEPLASPEPTASFDEIVTAPAVQLFARRAAAASADFELTPEITDAVSEICRRLDGLPLAVELAAARVRSLSPADIVGYLEDRFRLLRRAPKDQDRGRHRTLEDAVRWSYDLLDEPTRSLFDQLSVFAGPFDLAAVVAVTAEDRLDALERLETLEAHSMIVGTGDDRGARYALLETLRAFAADRLETVRTTEAVRRRHLDWYLRLVEEAAVGLKGPDEARWVRTLGDEFANLRAAWITARDAGEPDACLRLIAGLHDYAFFRMRHEVRSWAAEAIEVPGAAEHPLYVRARASAAYLTWQAGDLEEAKRLMDGLDGADTDWVAQDALATLAVFSGDIPAAIDRYANAAAIARRTGDAAWEAQALAQLTFARFLAGTPDLELAATSTAVATTTGNPTALAIARWAEGVARYDVDPRGALEQLDVSVAIGDTVDNRMNGGAAAVSAAELRHRLGLAPARDDLEVAMERLEHWLAIGSPQMLWSTIRGVATMLARLGALQAAAAAIGAEAAAVGKVPPRERELRSYTAHIERVRDALGDETYERHTAYGAQLAPEELVAYLRGAATGSEG